MADNSVRTPGVGETIASDDIGSVKYQRVKINVGADGSANDVVPPSGDGLTASTLLAAGAMIYDGSAGNWYRARTAAADATSPAATLAAVPMLFNETSADRQRGNTEGTLLSLAARTATATTGFMVNYNARGVFLKLAVQSAGTGSLGVNLRESTFGVVIASFTTLTASTQCVIYPGAATGTNVPSNIKVASLPVPRGWYASVEPTDSSSWTYQLVYGLIV